MSLKAWLPSLFVGVAVAVLLGVFPAAVEPFLSTVGRYTVEMVTILPAVMVLMGLLTVFVSSDFIARALGRAAGVRGIIVAFILGTLPTGPLYVAFPFARVLREKGAGVANIVIFLSAWACIKLPQELVELRFLGARFMAARLVLTVAFVVVMALIIGATDNTPHIVADHTAVEDHRT